MPLENGWYMEKNDQWSGFATSLQVTETLHDEKSKYQHVQVFKTVSFGNVLVLDGVVQITERDEAAYQEMISHLPLMSHPNPKQVLVVGGGDGGVLRECVKHPSVENITICEIDQMVIDVSKKYLPGIAQAWDHPKVKLHCGDAAVFIDSPDAASNYDVIICDTSDPVGPAEMLFEAPFYRSMHKALAPGGRICSQGESMWNDRDLIERLVTAVSSIFDNVEYATTQIPTYPMGQIGFFCCSKRTEAEAADAASPRPSCRVPARDPPADAKFEYWTPALHTASFTLPAFMERVVERARAAGQANQEKQ